MENENCQARADSTGVCEKIYNAVAAKHAFRAIHRKSGRSNQPGVQTTQIAAKTNEPNPLQKPVAQHKAGCLGEVYIPIELGLSVVPKEKDKMAKPPAFVQNNGRVTISPAMIEPSGHSTTKEDTPKPVSQTKPHVAPKVELVIPQPEKLKPTVASGHDQLNKVASKKEAKQAVSPLMEEKLKLGKTASPNIIAIQGHGQGISAPPKVEPSKLPRMSVQEEQPKQKLHAAAIAKTIPTKNDQLNLHNKGDHEGKKPEHSTVNDKFSRYITRVTNKMKTPSNVSEETLNASPFKRLATRRDSFNDKVANYINRARKNIRTTSNVGDA